MHLRFGDPDKIAVDCTVRPDVVANRELWRGLVWLTVGGQVVGNLEDQFQEQIGIAIAALAGAARHTGKRRQPLLNGLSAQAALDLVMWAVYGNDKSHPELTDADVKLLAMSEILPSATGPAFDNWEAIIIETGDTETIVWRREGEHAPQSCTFPLGTFWAAAEQATTWLKSHA